MLHVPMSDAEHNMQKWSTPPVRAARCAFFLPASNARRCVTKDIPMIHFASNPETSTKTPALQLSRTSKSLCSVSQHYHGPLEDTKHNWLVGSVLRFKHCTRPLQHRISPPAYPQQFAFLQTWLSSHRSPCMTSTSDLLTCDVQSLNLYLACR